MARIQDHHWWFVGRRRILATLIRSLALAPDAQILEVGCGTGGNLAMLRQFGNVTAVEADASAMDWAAKRSGLSILLGRLPNDLPIGDQRFDLICLFDVLEHLPEDRASLERLRAATAPRGKILLTVPAYQWLWSEHDVYLHHLRRYTMVGLRRVCEEAALQVDRIGYFNTLLFPIAVAARIAERLSGRRRFGGNEIPPAPMNDLLRVIFGAERFALQRIGFPFGMSVFAVTRPAV
jgi:SAM-dependent methyltransferase